MSRSELQLTAEQLMSPRGDVAELAPLVARCVAAGDGLVACLRPGGMTLAQRAAEEAAADFKLVGQWRSPHLAHTPTSLGAWLVLPMLFWIEEMHFGPRALSSFGRETRMVSDLLMRLYVNAVSRQLTVSLETRGEPMHAGVQQQARNLQRTYMWLSKATIADEALHRGDVPERMLVDAHLEVFGFTDPMLRAGLAEFRAAAAADPATRRAAEQRRQLLQLRARWIEEARA